MRSPLESVLHVHALHAATRHFPSSLVICTRSPTRAHSFGARDFGNSIRASLVTASTQSSCLMTSCSRPMKICRSWRRTGSGIVWLQCGQNSGSVSFLDCVFSSPVLRFIADPQPFQQCLSLSGRLPEAYLLSRSCPGIPSSANAMMVGL